MSELTDRDCRALTVLRDEGEKLHPSRVAYLVGDRRPSAGFGWRNTLDRLERRGLVRSIYPPHRGGQLPGRDFEITPAGIEALDGEMPAPVAMNRKQRRALRHGVALSAQLDHGVMQGG